MKKDSLQGNIHPTAIIEDGVTIGSGTYVWDNVHIRKNTVIGENCIIGEKTYIAYNVKIGNGVKINSFVYICTAVTIEDQVMISAGTIFTNDVLPRSFDLDGSSVKTSEPTAETLETKIFRGATIGAGCTLGPGIELGEYCMIGMGSVITKDVAPHHLVYGQPGKPRGVVCICGNILKRFKPEGITEGKQFSCHKCGRRYIFETQGLRLKD